MNFKIYFLFKNQTNKNIPQSSFAGQSCSPKSYRGLKVYSTSIAETGGWEELAGAQRRGRGRQRVRMENRERQGEGPLLSLSLAWHLKT